MGFSVVANPPSLTPDDIKGRIGASDVAGIVSYAIGSRSLRFEKGTDLERYYENIFRNGFVCNGKRVHPIFGRSIRYMLRKDMILETVGSLPFQPYEEKDPKRRSH